MTTTKVGADGRSARGERARRRLTEAARLLFAEQGYSATSVEEVARAADASVGSLYHHFPGKSALLRRVLADARQQRWERVSSQVEPLALVRSLGDHYRELLEAGRWRRSCPLMDLAAEVARAAPDAATEIAEADREMESWLARALEGAGAAAPRRAALMITACLTGAVTGCAAAGTPEPLDAVMEELHEMFEMRGWA